MIRTRISKVLMSKKKLSGVEPDKESESESLSVDSETKEASKKQGTKILHPFEVQEHMKLLWKENGRILDLIFGNFVCNKKTLEKSGPGYQVIRFDYRAFFVEVLPVAPNRFRPENKLSDSTFLHPHTVLLQKILSINFELRRIMLTTREKQEAFELKETFSKWVELQDSVNGLFDATKCGKVTVDGDAGIKQLLEKKEGMFRMKIMGKRVNYAARSVISPDPLLDTNEVGVPLFVAKKLTFPEAVNEANIDRIKTLIRNGPNVWPGAVYMTEGSKRISFEGSKIEQREAIIKSLLSNAEQKVVYRHVMNGDVLLFNRQPTLHKPSLMSHIARVLPKEHTIRMHYANCNSYNADFDGDEMNLHLLQNHLARSEAYNLSLSDKQYIVPTNNMPIRGLIQDIILSAVFLTMKGAFFEKSEYFQLIYSSLRTLIEKESNLRRIKLIPPCIMKPRKLWSGKQIVSTIINIVAEKDENDEFAEKLYMQNKGKIHESHLSAIDKEDKQVLVQGNELMTGILDKSSIGQSPFGLIHCFYELTDSKRTGKLLSGLSRLFCNFLQMHGFTCGLDDLMTTKEFEHLRAENLKNIHSSALIAQAKFLGLKDYKVPETYDLFARPAFDVDSKQRLKQVLKKEPTKDYLVPNNKLSKKIEKKRLDDKTASGQIDTVIKKAISAKHNETHEKAVSIGLSKTFPDNCFSVMVLSGAKGSVFNHNQISCMLGQQELEGQRVPTMASGKTLPCFIPYDPNPRAGGYIGDRFLTGLRTQEFFFHCMAGREGLIDTAVKTSRSGYLQRILIKNMESLIIQYDFTVRENDGTVVQFLYGEDCIDPTKVNGIEKINFIADNYESFLKNSKIDEIKSKLDCDAVKLWKQEAAENPEKFKSKTIMSDLMPSLNFGSISKKAEASLENFIATDPRFKGDDELVRQLNKKKFRQLFYAKYYQAMAVPGESVGVIAGQSIGEPSTQMTLNTFHLAGHGGANMTLGVPRLRELLTTKNTGTPAMTLEFKDKSISKLKAKQFARHMQRVSLLELLNTITVVEQKQILDDKHSPLPSEKRFRVYNIDFQFEELKAIKFAFKIHKSHIEAILEKIFKPRLLKTLMKILNKKQKQADKKKGEDSDGVTNYDLENLKLRRKNEKSNTEAEDALPDQSEYDIEPNEDGDAIEEAKEIAENPKEEESEGDEGLIRDFNFSEGRCTFKIRLPLNTDKLLMLK